ncbi:MDR family MFS transporter [Brevibacillus migulae]|uniref:MDR family MFS transporter n=1 Tax=Brevibacillus migulae TaxID=1644114 RepID=UPI00142F8E92|nr:MFS transporter [Brevibacillus migulae]
MKHIIHAYTHRYHPTIQIRFAGELLTSVTGSMLAPFLLLYLHDKLGGSVMLPMLIVGLQPLTDIFITMISGGIADRIGRRPVILFALLLQIVAISGFIAAESVWAFALLYMLNGAGRSLYIPAQRAQIADLVDEKQRVEVFSILSTIGYAGQIAGPILGLLLFHFHSAAVFALEALSLTVYLLLFWWKGTESLPLSSAASRAASAARPAFSLSRFLRENRAVLALMVSTLPISFFYAQTETNLRIHLQRTFPDYLTIIASLATAHAIMIILLQIWLVKRTESFPIKRILLIAGISYFTAALLLGFAHSFALLLAAQFAMTIGEVIGLTHLLNYVAALAPPEKRGLYFSLYGMHWDISRTVGPVLGGWMLTHSGGQALFTLCALLLGAGMVAHQLVIHWITRSHSARKETDASNYLPYQG